MECKVCHNRFEPKHWNQLICSKACVKEQRRLYDIDNRASIKPKRKQREQSLSYKEYYRKYMNKYRTTEAFKLSWKKYIQSPLGKECKRRNNSNRRAAKNNYIETFTSKEWLAKKEATKGMCPGYKVKPHYVGIDKLTLDHSTIPVSKAKDYFIQTGKKKEYTINDVEPLCQNCNSRKHNKIISQEDC